MVGRFAQADSIVPEGVQGLDRYAYANNSPLNYTDPSGHCSVPVVGPMGTTEIQLFNGVCPWEKNKPADIDIGKDVNVIPLPEYSGPDMPVHDFPEWGEDLIHLGGESKTEIKDLPTDDNPLADMTTAAEDTDEDDGDDWEQKKPEEGTVENPDGTTTTFIVRKSPGADGGWSRMVIIKDANGRTIGVVHESWSGKLDPRVDPPDHRHPKPVNRGRQG